MSGERVDFEDVKSDVDDGGRTYERSTIDFPYLDLDAAVEVAKAVHSAIGQGACEIDLLAAEMNQTVSGAFRTKTATARQFGLIEKDGRSAVKLTPLGKRIIEPSTEKEARTEAFLSVPLYAKVYEKYRGSNLPPAKALEREMQGLGVAQKQSDRARQTFDRSARQAGFFNKGEGRLIKPVISSVPAVNEPSDKPNTEKEFAGGDSNGGSGGGIDPIIGGLLARLPNSGAVWPEAERKLWLDLLEGSFRLIYKDIEPSSGSSDQKQG